MVGRNPARFLAPIALIAFAFALFSTVKGDDPPSREDGNRTSQEQDATPTATAEKKSSSKKKKSKTYTVKSGDTASGIAEKNNVDLETLMELNPELDPATLSPGQKIKIEG